MMALSARNLTSTSTAAAVILSTGTKNPNMAVRIFAE